MAGHSKWANIRHRKGAQDAKRGKIFTKLVKEIYVAAKIGGSDIDSNPRLRLAIQNAKGFNLPKDNIERAIKKAEGAGGEDYQEVTYEGYAPGGVAVFVECTTDNITRTVQNVRSYFNKVGGNLGTNGSLEFIFDRRGIFQIKSELIEDAESFELEVIDAGAEDIEQEGEYMIVSSAMADFGNLQKKLDELNIESEEAGLQRIPNTNSKVEDEDVLKKILKLIDLLEDDDDVQKVYHNLEMTDEQMASMA